jgi:hypothetical protein
MKTMILAAVAALSLGVGSAHAQGAPAGFADGTDYQGPGAGPAYGAQAFADHRNEASVQFLGPNTVLGRIFRYNSESNHQAAVAATSAKGG